MAGLPQVERLGVGIGLALVEHLDDAEVVGVVTDDHLLTDEGGADLVGIAPKRKAPGLVDPALLLPEETLADLQGVQSAQGRPVLLESLLGGLLQGPVGLLVVEFEPGPEALVEFFEGGEFPRRD